MEISIISDLHCRSKSFPASFDVNDMAPADVLVVAGDLATHVNYSHMLDKLRMATKDKFGAVICIKGNHDYYVTDHHWLKHHDIPLGPTELDNFVVQHTVGCETVDFICSPMWSPITKDNLIKFALNDYNYISGFTTEKCTELFWNNLDWIERQASESMAAGRKFVIVTHHLPIPELIEAQFAGSDINEAFCVLNSDASERIRKIKPCLWIHGHSHSFMDKTVDGVRYVRNAYGYEWSTHQYDNGSRKEITGYQKDFIVTI